MGLITKIDAAIALGVGMELLEYFCKTCPKPNAKRKLPVVNTDQGEMIDEDELRRFQRFLHDPWPMPAKGARPSIPKPIREDIKRESHLACAICGNLNKGEVAHITAVADTMNNGPDNLIFLCPNHHTEYDYGFKLSTNVTEEEVRAAKLIKRMSRQRMMKYEQDVTRLLRSLLASIRKIQADIKGASSKNFTSIYETEAKTLLGIIPELTAKAQEKAKSDAPSDEIEKLLVQKSPLFAKASLGVQADSPSKTVREALSGVSALANDVLVELDEVECPRCHGRGMTGLIGNFCAYCGGSCYVTEKEAEKYDPSKIDEVKCPHCKGNGVLGYDQHYCPYCHGACLVSSSDAEEYDPDEIDEVKCPHCKGNGILGYDQHFCPYCNGACRISQEESDEYDPDEIDEVKCPHCKGNGVLGYDQHYCPYCNGACRISRKEADEYDPDEIDEVKCPHCKGNGVLGYDQHYCPYCNGACRVSQKEADEYDPNEIDEVKCPHCHGSGTRGLVGDPCKLCGGACVVDRAKAAAYRERYGDRD